MSAHHMALAKAFPDHFTYEPHEVDAVSRAGTGAGPGVKGWGRVIWGLMISGNL